ncbi:hypothetical protein PYW07_008774 [Mythimna separata]|uniref:Peptidase M14 domain-containing protein n=1 Tax=Mythimna separata TaxID=271217 RepID=A0AAD7YE60_MYTSE|nr:hypothetical protein PYW07_008774 [Mythimna separata]
METRYLLVLCAAVLGLVTAGKHDIYSRHSVYNVQVRNKADQHLLHELEQQLELDIWQNGVAGVREAQIMVGPERQREFLQALELHGIQYSLHLNDVAEAFELHDRQMDTWRATRRNRKVFQDYPRYEEVNEYLEDVARRYPNLVTLVEAGKSYEGRDIKYLKISTTNFEDKSKPIYFMTTMIHAREWVTTPTTLYSIHRLVENLRTEDTDVLNDVDWIILPLLNPDGYEYSHTVRLWRKTRSNHANNPACLGVDGNRNFGKNWATIGVSPNPCSDIYPGPEAFSEQETRNVRDIMQEYLDRIQLFMDIHSFGKYVTFGYGDESLPDNAAQLHLVGSAMGAAIDARKQPQAGFYLVGNSATLMYNTSGCAQDFGQDIGIPFSYTLELPSYGYDFRVPPTYVDIINEETWHGIAASARLARSFYRVRYNAATRS